MIPVDISEKIYRLRNSHELTQKDFAKIAGASDKAVSTWERGTKEPRMVALQRICAHFNIDLNKFTDTESNVYDTEKPTPEKGDELSIDPLDMEILDLARKLPTELKEQLIKHMELIIATR